MDLYDVCFLQQNYFNPWNRPKKMACHTYSFHLIFINSYIDKYQPVFDVFSKTLLFY
jgi:hypothetical protein